LYAKFISDNFCFRLAAPINISNDYLVRNFLSIQYHLNGHHCNLLPQYLSSLDNIEI